MTILPKKKVPKDKNDAETTDHSQLPHSSAHQFSHSHTHSSSENRARARNSPTLDGDANESTSGLNKRRHRSPPHPHRNRKHRGHSHTHRRGVVEPAPSISSSAVEVLEEEHNSEDESNASCPRPFANYSEEMERYFEKKLKDTHGFIIKHMGNDGACLFRSVADQLYGDQEMHKAVRKLIVDYISKNRDHFSQYITEDFNTYLNRKRMDSCHGNHIELQAIAEAFNRPVEVFQYSTEPINTFHGAYETDNTPIRVSYHRNVHYNSVVDPYNATIGVGLGLPGYQPGLADKNLMTDACKKSEDFHIEKTMLEDKMRETDWELTQDTIEEQVARESYLQWLRDNEKRAKSPRTASAACSSAAASGMLENISSPCRSPRNRNSNHNSPLHPGIQDTVSTVTPNPAEMFSSVPGSSKQSPKPASLMKEESTERSKSPEGAFGGAPVSQETASLMTEVPASAYGYSDWGDDDIIAQVIAQSQQEYINSLRKNVTSS